jgi:predicted ribonuclease YlaK
MNANYFLWPHLCKSNFRLSPVSKILIFVKIKALSTIELKAQLHQYIDNADETFLKMVHAMSKEYKKTEVIGYTVGGVPLTQFDIKRRVKAASKRVKSGDYIAQEEIEIKNW